MRKCLYLARVLILGLLTAQIIAFMQVYLSDIALYKTIVRINDAGYLAVPNLVIMHSLKAFAPAFYGGLFFTLTVGAGLSVVSFVIAWIWDSVLYRSRFASVVIIILWIFILVWVNIHGFSLLNSAYFLFVPTVVVWASLRWRQEDSAQDSRKAIHLSLFFILFLIWGWRIHADSGVFINIRDNVMLSNPIGAKINEFYYKYTLYPAEVIKSLDQKLMRTCSIDKIENKKIQRSLEKLLLRYNYLVMTDGELADLEITTEEKSFILKNRGKEVARHPINVFFSKTRKILSEFSIACDTSRQFRQIIFFSLLIGQPVCIYILVYTFFCVIARFFLDFRAASVTASVLCLATGILLLLPLFHGGKSDNAALEPADLIASADQKDIIDALKMIEEKKMEIFRFPEYKRILQSKNVPDRYWLARAMGASKVSETYNDLISLLDDPNPNVTCMAYQALGKRKIRRGIKEILKRIKTSDHWYQQWYAYKALGALGWKQRRSK